MEQLCAECDTIDDFITALEKRTGLFMDEPDFIQPGLARQISLSKQRPGLSRGTSGTHH
jgi:hypothetical protein